jgi:hypothetical protein
MHGDGDAHEAAGHYDADGPGMSISAADLAHAPARPAAMGGSGRRLLVSDGMTGAATARGIAEVVLSMADAGANEYRYFDPARLGNWAGPSSHWRRAARPAAAAAGAAASKGADKVRAQVFFF